MGARDSAHGTHALRTRAKSSDILKRNRITLCYVRALLKRTGIDLMMCRPDLAACDHLPDLRESVGERSPHDLLNEATEWLQYAKGVTTLLADLIHEADAVDPHNMALSLEAIAAMTRLGVQRVGQAHAQWQWEAAAA
jgi:hypothetical protein